MGYFKTAVWGLGWTTALRGSIRVLSLLRLAVLARILLPFQFGAFGVAAMALALLEMVTETGINVFLLQERDELKKYIDTAWIVSIGRGFLVALLIFTIAPLVARFFADASLAPLLYLTCLVPIIRGFINPACVKFQKELEFNKEFLYRFALVVVELVTTVSIGWVTRSATSFVWGLILAGVVEVALSFIVVSRRPRWAFDLSQLRLILHRGKWVTGFGVLDYIFTQGDNIAVGRLLGQSSLGIYRTAYNLSTLPVTEVVDIYYKVSFPVYVKMTSYPDRLKRAVVKSVSLIAGGVLAISLGLFLLARPLVLLILGPNWISAVPVVRVLAFAGLFKSLSYSFNSLFVSLGLQKHVTAIIFVSAAILLITIIPAVTLWGIVGAGYSALLASGLTLPVTLFFAWRTLKSL